MTSATPAPAPSAGASEPRTAWGYGLATVTDDGTTLDVWYPAPELGAAPADAAVPASLDALAAGAALRGRGVVGGRPASARAPRCCWRHGAAAYSNPGVGRAEGRARP